MTNNNIYFIANWKMFGSVKLVNSLNNNASQLNNLLNEDVPENVKNANYDFRVGRP